VERVVKSVGFHVEFLVCGVYLLVPLLFLVLLRLYLPGLIGAIRREWNKAGPPLQPPQPPQPPQ